jgi:hypothetical protein
MIMLIPYAPIATTVALLLAPLTPARPGQAAPSVSSAPVERSWLDSNGDPLPLQTDKELEEFLRTAKVVKLERTSRGVAGAQKALLRKGDIEMHAVFRTVAIEERQQRMRDRVVWFFRDHYIHEPAAYALSELLGLEMVPPAVERTIRGTPGSLQLWLEDVKASVELKEKGIQAPDERAMLLQFYQMQLFDNLINNLDRNQGNILVDAQWRGWLIDHTRAFVRDRKLPTPQMVRRVERGVWERLRTVSDEELAAAVEPYIPGPERGALLERRRLLVELIQEKIDQVGEEFVLFDRTELETRP